MKVRWEHTHQCRKCGHVVRIDDIELIPEAVGIPINNLSRLDAYRPIFAFANKPWDGLLQGLLVNAEGWLNSSNKLGGIRSCPELNSSSFPNGDGVNGLVTPYLSTSYI